MRRSYSAKLNFNGPTLRSLLCNRRTPWVILALALGVRAAYLLQIDASPLFAYGELLPASLATFLDLVGLALLLRALCRPAFGRFLAAGMVFGLAALTVAAVKGDLVRAIQIFERVVKARPEQAEA